MQNIRGWSREACVGLFDSWKIGEIKEMMWVVYDSFKEFNWEVHNPAGEWSPYIVLSSRQPKEGNNTNNNLDT